MSRQLSFSATVCTLTLALFALVVGQGPAIDGTGATLPPAIGSGIR